MKVFSFLTIFLTVSPALLWAQVSSSAPVARVRYHETKIITAKEFSQTVQQLLESQGQDLPLSEITIAQRRLILDQLIETELMYQAALKSGISVDDRQVLEAIKAQTGAASVSNEVFEREMRARLTESDLTWESFLQNARRGLITQRYIAQEGQSSFESLQQAPSPSEVEKFFNEAKSQFVRPDAIRFSHIFLPFSGSQSVDAQRNKAQNIRQELQEGEITFEEAVRVHSEDPATQSKNGDFGFVPLNSTLLWNRENYVRLFGEEFLVTLTTLQKSQLSPVLTSSNGFHLVKVTDSLSQEFLDLDDRIDPSAAVTVRQWIAQRTQQRKQNQIIAEVSSKILVDLKKVAEIQVYEATLNQLS